MPVKHSINVRNARLDAIESTIGTGAVLRLRSGAPPVSVQAPDTERSWQQ